MNIPVEYQGRGSPVRQVGDSSEHTIANDEPFVPQLRDDTCSTSIRTIAAVVNRVAPSVVNIRIRSGDRSAGSGSGVYIAPMDSILTNSHVVHGTREIEVTLHDARVYSGRLIAQIRTRISRSCRIDAPDLQHVRLADSAGIRVGQIAWRSVRRMVFTRR
jgi:S1-C subfamily serine protease